MDIGVLVAQYRHQKGWTQVELAERAGITGSYVSLIENGTRIVSREMRRALAAALDAPVEEFLRADSPRDSSETARAIMDDRRLEPRHKALLLSSYQEMVAGRH